MNKKMFIFTVTFVFALTISLYYLGASITGYVAVSEVPGPTEGRVGFYSVLVTFTIILGVTYFLKRKEYLT